MESLSDVTDATRSASEGESADEDTLESMRRELKLLSQGRHPKYLLRVKQLEQEREYRMQQADFARQHELQLSEWEYLRELRAAKEEFEQEAQALKERLLENAETLRKRYEHQLRYDNLQLEYGKPSPRASRSKAHRQKHQTERKANVSDMAFKLADEEIDQDVLAVSAVPKALPVVEVSEDRKELLLRGQTFRLGQPVCIIGRQMQPIPGTIKYLQPNMIYVKHALKDRVLEMPLKHLQFSGMHIIPREK